MNVETGTEAAQCPEKEHLNGIFLAVYQYMYGYRLPVQGTDGQKDCIERLDRLR